MAEWKRPGPKPAAGKPIKADVADETPGRLRNGWQQMPPKARLPRGAEKRNWQLSSIPSSLGPPGIGFLCPEESGKFTLCRVNQEVDLHSPR